MNTLYLGLVCWLATLIIVESELTRPLREWLERRAQRELPVPKTIPEAHVRADYRTKNGHIFFFFFGTRPVFEKLRYAVSCHLCAGVWVGVVLAAIFGGPFTGPAATAANGLLYKAIGHLTLEVAALVRRTNP